MYPSDTDWEQELERVNQLAADLEKRKGSCAENAQALLQTARQYFELDQRLYDLIVFAN